MSFLAGDPGELYIHKRESLMGSLINFQLKNDFYHMESAVNSGKKKMEVGGSKRTGRALWQCMC